MTAAKKKAPEAPTPEVDDDRLELAQVRFYRPVLGPTGRSVETISQKAVDELFLTGDVVCWQKGGKVVFAPLSNVTCFEPR